MAALCAAAGLGPQYLAARWPDDIAVLEAIALTVIELRGEDRKDLARRIRNEVAEMLRR